MIHVIGDDLSSEAWLLDEWSVQKILVHSENCSFLCRTAEFDQSKAGISRLRAWVSGQGEDYLSEEDIVIAASVDEVLSPDTLTR